MTNGVQTNLTKVDNRRIELMKHGFDSVGVSLDLAGGLHVTRAGKDMEPTVVKNIDRIRQTGIRFGGITVLAYAMLPAEPAEIAV